MNTTATDPFTTVIEIFQHTQADLEAEREATRAKRIATLTENFQTDLEAWLPSGLLAALEPAAPVSKSFGGDHLYLERAIHYQGHAGSIRYYDSGSPRTEPKLTIEFGDSAAWRMGAAIKLDYPKDRASANPIVRIVEPAILSELGQLFHLLSMRAADDAAKARTIEADKFFYGRIYDLQTAAEIFAFYRDEYVPRYGADAARVKAIQGEIAKRAENLRYQAERDAEQARQAEARAVYQARTDAAQAEADALWHPFTVYRIEYGAVVSDGDGSSGPALDNVYTLEAEPDAEGWYRRVVTGKVTRVRIPGRVLVEEIKVETPGQARYLPVCQTWSKEGAFFALPPDTVLVGSDAPAEADGEGIPF